MRNPKIGALWVRKSKDGKTYMSGVIEKDMIGALFMRAIKEDKDISIVCFKDNEKKNDKMPDFKIIVSEPQERKAVNDDFGDVFGSEPVPVRIAPKISDDDIPVINEGIIGDEVNVEEIPF